MTDTATTTVSAPTRMLDRERAEEYAEWFRTLSDATRVQILAWIAQRPGGASVKDLTAAFPQSQSTVSHHLAALTGARFLAVTRTGTQANYTVNPACTDEMPDAVSIITGTCCTDTAATECCGDTQTTSCCDTASAPADSPNTPGQRQPSDAGTVEDDEPIREQVRRRYANIAKRGESGCCGSAPLTRDGVFGASLYSSDDREGATDDALALSLGCGIPTTAADLRPGEVVVDLGSGAGADALIAAHLVGDTGRVVGIDMTLEMIQAARQQAAEANVNNVSFEQAYLEQLPLKDDSVDVIISNCVINLTADKRAALTEAFRVLAPGGRLAISDVVLTSALDDDTRADMTQWTGCIAGALGVAEYRALLKAVGFASISVTPTHAVHAAAKSATVRAVKPLATLTNN